VLLFAFEEAGLLRRGPDCTLEATVLLNHPIEALLDEMTEPMERTLLARLLATIGAAEDRQAPYDAQVDTSGGRAASAATANRTGAE
jgi:hypothetical protein